MCGLYSFRRGPEEVRRLFGYAEDHAFPPRPHVAPGSPVGIVRLENGTRRFVLVRWGFVPAWKKEFGSEKPMVNARSETVLDKPSFRNAMRRRRCLVPADGFYAWKGDVPGRKQAYFIHRPGDALFGFAGLWEHWMGADGSEIESALIITTPANRTLAHIHPRLPAVIDPRDFDRWLDAEGCAAEEAAGLLAPAPDDFFIADPVDLARRPKPQVEEEPKARSDPDRQPRLL